MNMRAALFVLTVEDSDIRSPGLIAEVVVLSGEVDTTNATDFFDAVGTFALQHAVILDMSDTDFMDSAGFAALDRLIARYTVAVVLPITSPLRRIADLLLLQVYDDRHSALVSLKRATG